MNKCWFGDFTVAKEGIDGEGVRCIFDNMMDEFIVGEKTMKDTGGFGAERTHICKGACDGALPANNDCVG